jgi:hypothetical protein
MSKNGTIMASVAAIAGIAVIVWLQLSVFNEPDMTDNPTEKLLNTNIPGTPSGDPLKESIKTLNNSCPRQVDEETRLDSVVYMPGNVFAEYFTLLNAEEITSSYIISAKQKIEESIINTIKTNPAFTLFKNNNYTFTFAYRDKTQKPLFNLTITPEQYHD